MKQRRGLGLPMAILIAALVSACAAGLLVLTGHSSGTALSNRALVDSAVTTRVAGDVSNELAQVLSYSPDNTQATEKAAASALVDKAAGQYQMLFAEVRQQAPAQRIALTTRVVRTGVVTLSGDRADLLVFLDQTTSRQGRPTGQPIAAQLSITARLRSGHWRIADIRSS